MQNFSHEVNFRMPMTSENNIKILFVLPLYYRFDEMVAEKQTDIKKSRKQKLKGIKAIGFRYPNGVLSLAAYVHKYFPNADIRILDFNLLLYALTFRSGDLVLDREQFWAECLSFVSDFEPDLVGISTLFSSMFFDLAPLATFLKQQYPHTSLVAGGNLATGSYARVLDAAKDIDALCYGEGERPFLDLISALAKGSGEHVLRENDSWITREKVLQKPYFRPVNDAIHDLDEIPPFNLNLVMERQFYKHNAVPLPFIASDEALDELSILTTRGCPGKCVFCASRSVHGSSVRMFSAQRVKEDIAHYRQEYGIQKVVFTDDHFLLKKARSIEILGFIEENKISCAVGTAAFFSIDAEVSSAMQRAGVTDVNISPESANEDTLRNIIHKPGTIAQAKAAIEHLHEAGILVFANLIFGLPGETKEAIDLNIRNAVELNANWYYCAIATPLPGSELYEICMANDYLAKDADPFAMGFKKAVIQTPDFSPQYIERKAYEANLYLNFVTNYDMRSGNFLTALRFFEGVFTEVQDSHAFAYYFAALCAHSLGLKDKAQRYTTSFERFSQNPFWGDWVYYFGLPPLSA